MKFLAYSLIILTLILSIKATSQQISGRADISSPGRSLQRNVALRLENPDEFQHLMTYQWIRALLPATGGIFLLCWIRRSKRLDPFSPDFQGKNAIDELEEHLNHKTNTDI